MLDPSRPWPQYIPKKTNEDNRVASCILSLNMLDDDGLNGEIKCPPPEILWDRSRVRSKQTAY
jgi:hypothetical protein